MAMMMHHSVTMASYSAGSKSSTFILCMLLTATAPMVAAQARRPVLTPESLTLAIKARQIGYRMSDFRNFRPTVGGDRVRILFLDSRRAAFAWLAPESPAEKPVGPATGVPSKLKISILDLNTGKQVLHHEWQCTSLDVNIALTASGQWLVVADRTVTLYSESFDRIKEIQNVRTLWSANFMSPDGRTFLTYTANQGSAQLRDSATLETLDSWNDSRIENIFTQYSSQFVLAQAQQSPTLLISYIRELKGTWKPYSEQSLTANRVNYGFVNDNTIVSLSTHEAVATVVDGAELFRLPFPDSRLMFLSRWSTSAVARSGQRFAIILDRLRGVRNEVLDMYPFPSNDRVVVYSLAEKAAIFSVSVNGESPWAIRSDAVSNRIALSPDGSFLGIISADGARIYRLP